MQRKSEIRKETLKARLALARHEVARKSAIIQERIQALEEYRRADYLMLYIDTRNEARTIELIKISLALGKKVAIPLTDIPAKNLKPSLLLNFPEDLAPGPWGILEPAAGCFRPVEIQKIDMVIVPGVAFDERGNRLGYGGGFYDRFLPLTSPDTFRVAPAFELQIKPEVCPGPHDCPVHCLVTEKRVIYTKK